MNVYEIDFSPMWPVPSGLIIVANTKREALKIARKTVRHTLIRGIEKIDVSKPRVVFYESGDY